jgi:hypothetical protein
MIEAKPEVESDEAKQQRKELEVSLDEIMS